ncbi:SDR family NAD(P)-dependent oxidoreductase [Streptomyces sp. NPDC056749]|uniref:SDR family NAD(P)-dependent oxidoreductase n=1 Tax=Streptomyces sp. NPDC056749 TaxID=3345936 RepID=UPI0036CAE183
MLTESVAWPVSDRPRRAGISSFGISGTNAHVIIEQAPPTEDVKVSAGANLLVPWVLSAKTDAALQAQHDQLLEFISERPETAPQDVAHSLATGRSQFSHRTVLLSDGTVVAKGISTGSECAFLFTGQGARLMGVGRKLYRAFPAFAQAFNEASEPELRAAILDEDGQKLERTEYAQPALFAVEVALARLLESLDVRPSLVIGHSIGEIAAAHVAGVFSLADARRLIEARGRLMQALPSGGAMLGIRASEEYVRSALPSGTTIAAVNSPRAVVVAGNRESLVALREIFPDSKFLNVKHAFHSDLMRPILNDFRKLAHTITYRKPQVSFISTMTGSWVSNELCDPEYWVSHVTSKVRFADAVQTATKAGKTTFLEIGPDAILSSLGPASSPDAEFVPTMRRKRDEVREFLAALGKVHARGVSVDWAAICTDGRMVDLPTYPFQREHYWLAADTGLFNSDDQRYLRHPVLQSVVDLPTDGGTVGVGRLSRSQQTWLTDHEILGRVLLPGTGFVEMACRVGEQIGCLELVELTLEAPLEIPQSASVEVRVETSPLDDQGQHSLTINSRSESGPTDRPWTRHCRGVLGASTSSSGAVESWQWPPPGAALIDGDAAYQRLLASGYQYGPSFQAVQSLWRRGDEVFAEVALPDTVPDQGFVIHPALLDACLHAVLLAGDPKETILPFAFSGVVVHTTGVRRVRVRIDTSKPTTSVQMFGVDGRAVASIAAVAGRPATAAQLGSGPLDSLWEIAWEHLPPSPGMDVDFVQTEWLFDAEQPVPPCVGWRVPDGMSVRETVALTLRVLQHWMAEERFAAARLIVLTNEAVAVEPNERVSSLAHAAVWGLVRAAQAEHPGRIVLADGRTDTAHALARDEPELAIRDGEVLRPLLAAVKGVEPQEGDWTGGGTVLVTGGTGGLGALVAEHLVRHKGVRELLLLSRRGMTASADVLRAELASWGANVRVVACDVADRDALASVLAAETDISAIVHAAGVVDNAVLTALNTEQIDRVFASKVTGALNLHELTRDLSLSAFVLFSSAAGLVLGAGQGAYAAGNAFLDGLASLRRAENLPATSIAWGLWEHTAGAAGAESAATRYRMGRLGMPPIPTEAGLTMLDHVVNAGMVNPVSLQLDLAALRKRTDDIPPVLRAIARRLPGLGVAPSTRSDPLIGHPTGTAQEGRTEVLLGMVRGAAATVLGFRSEQQIDPDRQFNELGFDSLTSVEFRNVLSKQTGVRLSASLVFEHRTVHAVVAHLSRQLERDADSSDELRVASDEPDAVSAVRQSVVDVYLTMRRAGQFAEMQALAGSASAWREVSNDLTTATALCRMVPILSNGDRGVHIVSFPSLLTSEPVISFGNLANSLRNFDMSVAIPPGFDSGEPMAGSWDTLIAGLAQRVSQIAQEQPVVLFGHSSGGVIAHEVASLMERNGVPIQGIVLLDTLNPDELTPRLLGVLLRRNEELSRPESYDYYKITALAYYGAMTQRWKPKPTSIPTLALRPAEPPVESGKFDLHNVEWRHVWPVPHLSESIPGDHFSMMIQHAHITAETISDWISNLPSMS